jgi:hypothetical protein
LIVSSSAVEAVASALLAFAEAAMRRGGDEHAHDPEPLPAGMPPALLALVRAEVA